MSELYKTISQSLSTTGPGSSESNAVAKIYFPIPRAENNSSNSDCGVESLFCRDYKIIGASLTINRLFFDFNVKLGFAFLSFLVPLSLAVLVT